MAQFFGFTSANGNKITIEQVPEKYRTEVEALLAS